MNEVQVERFIESVSSSQGFPALSEAKVRRLGDPMSRLVVAEADRIQAVVVAAEHDQISGTSVWELECVVDPSMQFAEFEVEVLRAGLELVPTGARTTVWSQRRSLDAALADLGFDEHRVLAHMAARLPLTDTPTIGDFRTMRTDERETLVSLNHRAFEGHPEAGAMSVDDIAIWESEGWFHEDGVVMVDGENGPVGFCVTKVHPDGDGEIYRVGVQPEARGMGFGTTLAVAAYDLLAGDENTTRATLWVDTANVGAVALYRSIGLETTMVNREFARRAR